MIDITLLGTAALMPLPDRALTAAALTCCGRTVLFDCGEGTQTAARRAGVSLMKADLIALTHYHGDHILGLPGLMQTMSCLGRTEPLAVTGPEGLHEAMAPLMALAGPVAFPVRLIALPPEGLAMDQLHAHWPGGARLSAFATEHRVPSQGYAFTLARPGRFMPERARALGVPVKLWGPLQRGQTVEFDGAAVTPDMVLGAARKGLRFVFSGDTAYCPSLVETARGADLMICEATYALDEQAARAEAFGHMDFRRAAQAAAQAEVGEAWLAHYSQMIEDPEAYLEDVRKVFPRVRCGRDGMRKTLRFAEDDRQLTVDS